MEQLLCHCVGDYLLQSDWMAQNKKSNSREGYLACLLHCITYSTPFLLITNIETVVLICITHFAIDKTNFIEWYCKAIESEGFYNNLKPWSGIAVDNTFHIITNYFLIKIGISFNFLLCL